MNPPDIPSFTLVEPLKVRFMKLPIAFVALLLLLSFQHTSGDDWPGWRGGDRSDVSQETGLLKEWPKDGPERVWLSKKGGVGYSGFAVVGDNLYTMGAFRDDVRLICLDANTGERRWMTVIAESVLENGWGDGPRGTPTVDGDHVFVMAGEGSLMCAKADTGELVWKVKMGDFGGRIPKWGYAESVLIDGDNLICTPGGGDGAIVALNKLTGQKIWQSKDFTDTAGLFVGDCR